MIPALIFNVVFRTGHFNQDLTKEISEYIEMVYDKVMELIQFCKMYYTRTPLTRFLDMPFRIKLLFRYSTTVRFLLSSNCCSSSVS